MDVCRLMLLYGLFALTAAAAEPVTSLVDLRALTAEEAGKGLPVRIQGTVVGLEPSWPSDFFLHDGTAGCFVKTIASATPANLVPGDLVVVEGVSDPLGYFPSIRNGRVKVIHKGKLPEPVKPGAGEMFSPELDSEWVEVPAVVTGFEVGDNRVTLGVEVYGLPFKAELPVCANCERQAAALMLRPVRLRGVMGTIFNRQRQMTDRHFFVSSFDSIQLRVSESNVAACPLLTISQLLTGGYGPSVLVRVQGVVTQQDPKGFYLRDSTGSTLIQAVMAGHFPHGALVEVQGFGSVAPYRPVLRAIQVKGLGTTADVKPVPFAFQSPDLSALHSEWVTLDADFLGGREGPVNTILQFRCGDRFFEAVRPNGKHGALPALLVGDRLRLTGICELTTTHALPRPAWVDGFRIHLPETGGIEILRRAPWWDTRRLFVALGLMSGVAALGFLGAWTMRRQVKHQMSVIGDKLRTEAVGEERDRMARELHDTLEQHLSGVALQLDGLDYAVNRNPAAVSSILFQARRMVRHTRLEARRSVWDLRSKVLENDGLAAALRAIQETDAGSPGPAVTVQVTGTQRAHAPGVDFHLLRIAQEAVTNAVKHGEARAITISLDYLPDETRMTILDDGRGFDPAAAQSPGPHFGLLGMRERASKIRADLRLASLPGKGCRVTVIMPDDVTTKPS